MVSASNSLLTPGSFVLSKQSLLGRKLNFSFSDSSIESSKTDATSSAISLLKPAEMMSSSPSFPLSLGVSSSSSSSSSSSLLNLLSSSSSYASRPSAPASSFLLSPNSSGRSLSLLSPDSKKRGGSGENIQRAPKKVRDERDEKAEAEGKGEAEAAYEIDYTKRPPISLNVFTWGVERYEVKQIKSSGQMNHIWMFCAENRDINIKSSVLNTSHLMIKSPREERAGFEEDLRKKKNRNGQKQSSFFKDELHQTIKTYRYFTQESTRLTLKNLDLKIPVHHFTPLDEPSSAAGGFWIVEKIQGGVSFEPKKDGEKKMTELSPTLQKILNVVKNVLTYMFKERSNKDEKLRLLDLHPGNVMGNANDEVFYVDAGMQWEMDNSKNVGSFITTCLNAWAPRGAPIRSFLEANIDISALGNDTLFGLS